MFSGSGCHAATTPPHAAAQRFARTAQFAGSLCAAGRGTARSTARRRYLFTVLPTLVPQTCSLLYRRFVTCGSSAISRDLGVTGTLPITNRRYGRLKICATVNRYAEP